MSTVLNELKQLLIEEGVKHDPWGAGMSVFFQVSAHLYAVSVCPPEWQYRPGMGGNYIDPEDSLTEFLTGKTADELLEMGNYLYKFSNACERAGLSY